jgi:hypothetical protein
MEATMPTQVRQKRSLSFPFPFSLRLKIVIVSLLSFLVTSGCSLLRLRPTPKPPTVTCYEPTIKIEELTPSPFVLCYEMMLLTETPDSTLFTSPLSPLPTPTPTATPEARRLLLGRLLAEGRFPQDVAGQLSELQEG